VAPAVQRASARNLSGDLVSTGRAQGLMQLVPQLHPRASLVEFASALSRRSAPQRWARPQAGQSRCQSGRLCRQARCAFAWLGLPYRTTWAELPQSRARSRQTARSSSRAGFTLTIGVRAKPHTLARSPLAPGTFLRSALGAPTTDPHAGFRGEFSRFLGPRGTGGFLAQLKSELDPAQRATFADHATAPFCWLERPGGALEAEPYP
jgi:hypothetical protein